MPSNRLSNRPAVKQNIKSIAVLGAGSWGTALAILLAKNGIEVHLWGHDEEILVLQQQRENSHFLPGIPFPDKLQPEPSLQKVLDASDEILIVVPSHAFRAVLNQIAEICTPKSICWATKGFDPQSRRPLSLVAHDIFPLAELAVLSGPTFAVEVAQGQPTAITVAATSERYAERLAAALQSDSFRAYTSYDLIGVQVGGAIKNIMAIAAGLSDGLGFGANARAALITRGLAEITRIGKALGAHTNTFMGLTGLGDLTLTCTDDKSRNRRMGLALARGLKVEQAREEIGQEVEGVHAAKETWLMAQELDVDMPITHQVYRILYEDLDPRVAVKELLHRRQKAEPE
ncbi:MAG: NAD(P)-dependent glycerol-3-phosphate dehydrogenase [Gammaproteobacteria bacterium]|nr:NAD(P)-dependent glycerol-3-phosphate dehydrogenase [Gammaproteobacteria bacterium]